MHEPRPAQEFLTGEHVVMADTGDCIFWTQRLRLPEGAGSATWKPHILSLTEMAGRVNNA